MVFKLENVIYVGVCVCVYHMSINPARVGLHANNTVWLLGGWFWVGAASYEFHTVGFGTTVYAHLIPFKRVRVSARVCNFTFVSHKHSTHTLNIMYAREARESPGY